MVRNWMFRASSSRKAFRVLAQQTLGRSGRVPAREAVAAVQHQDELEDPDPVRGGWPRNRRLS
jgi:hypothetical protein